MRVIPGKKRPPARRKTGNTLQGRHEVAIEPCVSYNPDKVYYSLQRALQSIKFTVPSGRKVLLKPNIIAQNTPEQAVTTHPALVDAVCRLFSDHRCTISIGDSSAFYQGGGTREGFETTGIAGVARKYNARIIPFETTKLRKITSGEHLNPFFVTEAVFENDMVVNLPKLKLHRLARYTGAIKNMYGCVVGGTKQLYHMQYQHMPDYQEFWGKPLVDVYEAVAPHLSVMDAIIGLDKDGPAANGEPRFTGLILASTSGAALDAAACRIIGFDPDWVPAVREAVSRGLINIENIVIHGSIPSIPYVHLPDTTAKEGLSRKIDDYLFRQFLVTPKIDPKKCTRCGACVEMCAVQAIRIGADTTPEIEYNKCINCYCCESACKDEAIHLQGSAVNHIIRGMRQLLKI